MAVIGSIAVEYLAQGAQRFIQLNKDAAAALAQVESKTKTVQDHLRGVVAPLADASKAVVRFGDGLIHSGQVLSTFAYRLMLITAPLAKFIYEVGQAGTELETVMAMVATQLDKGEGYIARFTEETTRYITDLSTEFPLATDDIAKAMYYLVSSLTIDPEVARLMLEPIAKAAVAGRTTAEEAAKAATVIMNVYDLISEDAEETARNLEHVYDVIFEAVKKGRAEYEDMAVQLGDFVQFAKAAGATFEEAMALFAQATRITTPSQAATWIGNLYRVFIQPAFAEEIMEWGIAIEDASGKMRPAIDVLMDIAEAVKGASSEYEQLNMIAAAFPRIRAVQGFLVFLENLTEIEEWTRSFTEAIGTTDEAFSIMVDTVEAKLTILKNVFIAIGLDVFETYKEDLKRFLDFLADVLKKMREMDPELKKQVLAWSAFLLALGPIALVLGTILMGLGGLITTLGTLISPVALGGAILAIDLFGDLFAEAGDAVDAFGGGLPGLIAFLASLAVELGLIPKAEAEKALEALGIEAMISTDKVAPLAAEIRELVDTISEFADKVKTAAGWIAAHFDTIALAVKGFVAIWATMKLLVWAEQLLSFALAIKAVGSAALGIGIAGGPVTLAVAALLALGGAMVVLDRKAQESNEALAAANQGIFEISQTYEEYVGRFEKLISEEYAPSVIDLMGLQELLREEGMLSREEFERQREEFERQKETIEEVIPTFSIWADRLEAQADVMQKQILPGMDAWAKYLQKTAALFELNTDWLDELMQKAEELVVVSGKDALIALAKYAEAWGEAALEFALYFQEMIESQEEYERRRAEIMATGVGKTALQVERELKILEEAWAKEQEAQRKHLGQMLMQQIDAWAEIDVTVAEHALEMKLVVAEQFGIITEETAEMASGILAILEEWRRGGVENTEAFAAAFEVYIKVLREGAEGISHLVQGMSETLKAFSDVVRETITAAMQDMYDAVATYAEKIQAAWDKFNEGLIMTEVRGFITRMTEAQNYYRERQVLLAQAAAKEAALIADGDAEALEAHREATQNELAELDHRYKEEQAKREWNEDIQALLAKAGHVQCLIDMQRAHIEELNELKAHFAEIIAERIQKALDEERISAAEAEMLIRMAYAKLAAELETKTAMAQIADEYYQLMITGVITAEQMVTMTLDAMTQQAGDLLAQAQAKLQAYQQQFQAILDDIHGLAEAGPALPSPYVPPTPTDTQEATMMRALADIAGAIDDIFARLLTAVDKISDVRRITEEQLDAMISEVKRFVSAMADLVVWYDKTWDKLVKKHAIEELGMLFDVIAGIGDALESLIALTGEGVGALAGPAWETGLQRFFDALDAFIAEFVSRAEVWQEQVNEETVALAGWVGETVASLTAAIEPLVELADYAPTQTAFRAGVDLFLANLEHFLDEFAWGMWRFKELASEEAAQTAELIGRAVVGLGEAVQPLLDLAEYAPDPAAMSQGIRSFFDHLGWFLDEFAARADDFEAKISEKSADLAELLGRAAGGLGEAVQPLLDLAEYTVTSAEFARAADLFFDHLALFIEMFAERADEFDAHITEEIAALAEAIGKTVGGIGAAIQPLIDLANYGYAEDETGAKVWWEPIALVQSYRYFFDDLGRLLLLLEEEARRWEAWDAAKALVEVIGEVTSNLGVVLGFLVEMADYGVDYSALALLGFQHFLADLCAIVAKVEEASGTMGAALEAARVFAEDSVKVLSNIRRGIDELNKLTGLGIAPENLVEAGKLLIQSLADGFVEALGTQWGRMLTAFSDQFNLFVNSYLPESMRVMHDSGWDIGANFIWGMIDGLATLASALYDTVGQIVKYAIGKAEEAAGAESESQEMYDLGADMMLGLLHGIAEGEEEVIEALFHAVQALVGAFAELVNWFRLTWLVDPEVLEQVRDVLGGLNEMASMLITLAGLADVTVPALGGVFEAIKVFVAGFAELVRWYDLTWYYFAPAEVLEELRDVLGGLGDMADALMAIADLGGATLPPVDELLAVFEGMMATLQIAIEQYVLDLQAILEEWALNVLTSGVSIGKALIDGIISGLHSKHGDLYYAVAHFIEEMMRVAESTAEAFSESRRMWRLGANMVRGLISGIGSQRAALAATLAGLADYGGFSLKPALAGVGAGASGGQVVHHHYEYNISPHYERVQSPADIRRDLEALDWQRRTERV